MSFDPSLCSVDDAREICGILDNSQDELLRQLVLAASAQIEAGPPDPNGFPVRANLKSRSYADTGGDEAALVVDGSGRQWQDVPYWPVTAATKVEYVSSYQPETWSEIDLATYPCKIDAIVPGRLFFRAQWFPQGCQNVRITMQAGYVTVPEDLRAATKLVVLALYKQPELQREGIISQSFPGGQSVTYDRSFFPPAAKALLGPYKRLVV